MNKFWGSDVTTVSLVTRVDNMLLYTWLSLVRFIQVALVQLSTTVLESHLASLSLFVI